jgi:hypothetical protein
MESTTKKEITGKIKEGNGSFVFSDPLRKELFDRDGVLLAEYLMSIGFTVTQSGNAGRDGIVLTKEGFSFSTTGYAHRIREGKWYVSHYKGLRTVGGFEIRLLPDTIFMTGDAFLHLRCDSKEEADHTLWEIYAFCQRSPVFASDQLVGFDCTGYLPFNAEYEGFSYFSEHYWDFFSFSVEREAEYGERKNGRGKTEKYLISGTRGCEARVSRSIVEDV